MLTTQFFCGHKIWSSWYILKNEVYSMQFVSFVSSFDNSSYPFYAFNPFFRVFPHVKYFIARFLARSADELVPNNKGYSIGLRRLRAGLNYNLQNRFQILRIKENVRSRKTVRRHPCYSNGRTFRVMTILSSAFWYWNGKTNLQLKFPSPVSDLTG